jgi:hypothetical protein
MSFEIGGRTVLLFVYNIMRQITNYVIGIESCTCRVCPLFVCCLFERIFSPAS